MTPIRSCRSSGTAIFALEDAYREPLALQVLMGHTTDEIAGIMGLTQGAVLTRLHRAREKLKQAFLEDGTLDPERYEPKLTPEERARREAIVADEARFEALLEAAFKVDAPKARRAVPGPAGRPCLPIAATLVLAAGAWLGLRTDTPATTCRRWRPTSSRISITSRRRWWSPRGRCRRRSLRACCSAAAPAWRARSGR
jgi:predicted DNA-binding protein (UPF0251 family)